MHEAIRVLIVDDNPYDQELIGRRLQRDLPESQITSVGRKRDFEDILERCDLDFDVILVDYQLGWDTGIGILGSIHERFAEAPVIMVTDTGSEETAVEAMKAGLSDYVLKRHLNRLSLSIQESLARGQLQREYDDAVERMRVSEQRYRAISEIISDFAYSIAVDPDGSTEYEWITNSFSRMTEFNVEEFISSGGWTSIIHPEDHDVAREHGLRALAGKVDRAEFRILTRSGEVRWVRNYITPVWDVPEGRVVRILGAAQDITVSRSLEQDLVYQARHDALTGLPNRAFFLNHLETTLAKVNTDGQLVAVLFIDLNNFKVINDSLGHQLGDNYLCAVAHRLKESLPSTSFIARYGGDEFIVLLEDVGNEQEAEAVAQQLIAAVQQPIRIYERELVTVPSIGIALGGATDESWSLIDRADVALYQAKRAETASHHAVFESTMADDAQERLDLETDVRRALDQSELRVHYQPVIELSTGGICEFEALVRWEHPDRGLVSPGEFIPLAEATGWIVPIGRWVLDEACRQLAEWQAQDENHAGLGISVNLSSRQFQHPALVSEIRQSLATAGLDPRSLTLEITESALMEDTDTTLAVLDELKSLGVHLAIDDFGTGYSSLSYLRLFPVDTVKIDRSFMRDAVQCAEDQALVRAIVVASKALQLHVTIEGIETAEQLVLAGKLGCDSVQGFYFSKPLPAGEIEHRRDLGSYTLGQSPPAL